MNITKSSLPMLQECLQLLHPAREEVVFEIRALRGREGKYLVTVSGYYNDPEKAAQDILEMDNKFQPENISVTINPVLPATLARANNRFIILRGNPATKDEEIPRYTNLFIDCDPIRPAGICSTDPEHKAALRLASKIKRCLQEDFGIEPVVIGDSGNGCHLIYRINLPNDPTSRQFVLDTLRAIAHHFDTQEVAVDTTTCNPSRLCRVYGTINRKGDSTTLRPHRKTKILKRNPSAPTITAETLRELVKRYGPARPQVDGQSQSVDLIHKIMIVCEEAGFGVAKFDASAKLPKVTLKRCPFNPEHTNSAILLRKDGSCQFKCFHTSCKGNRWPQFLDKLPPHLQERLPKSPEIDTSDRLQLTELGNARRLVTHFGDAIRYAHDAKSWFIWDGQRWKRDEDGQIVRFAKEITERILLEEALAESDPDCREAIVKYARRSQAKARIEAMIELAQSEPGVAVVSNMFDQNPWLINLKNGTYDLKELQFREHRREDLITKLSPVAYDASATCPNFMTFLNQIMLENEAMVGFLQRAFGYTLTGNTDERCLFLCMGTGANGKTMLLSTMMRLMGDYAKKATPETLLKKRSESIPNDIADLRGARMIHISEIGRGKYFNEALVKELTGGQEPIKARFLYAELFEFQPEFKLWIASNHRPEIGGRDEGIWSRIRLIPFNYTIPKEGRRPAHEMMEEFQQEFPGILNWAVKGCGDWHSYRLGETPEIRAATEEYRQDMDYLAEFLEDQCDLGPDFMEESSALFSTYSEWAKESNEKPLSRSVFGRLLKERGMISVRDRRVRKWKGLRLHNSSPGLNTTPNNSESASSVNN